MTVCEKKHPSSDLHGVDRLGRRARVHSSIMFDLTVFFVFDGEGVSAFFSHWKTVSFAQRTEKIKSDFSVSSPRARQVIDGSGERVRENSGQRFEKG